MFEKKVVADVSVREHLIIKRKWQQRNKKEENQQISSCCAIPTRPYEVSSWRGTKKVKRDSTKLYRDNIKLPDKADQLEQKVRKYNKRRKFKRDSSSKI